MNNSMYTHDFKNSSSKSNNNIKTEPSYSTISPLPAAFNPTFGYIPYLNNTLQLPWQLDYPWLYPFRHPVGNIVPPNPAMSLFSENAIHETLGYPAYNHPLPSTCGSVPPTWHLITGANDQVYMVPDIPSNIPCPTMPSSPECPKSESLNNSGSIISPNPKLSDSSLISPSCTPQPPPKAHSAPYSPAAYPHIPSILSPSMKQAKHILPDASSLLPNGNHKTMKMSESSRRSISPLIEPVKSDDHNLSISSYTQPIFDSSSLKPKSKDSSTQTKSCLCEPCLERQRAKIRPLSPIITEQGSTTSNLYDQIQEARSTNQFAFSAPPSALASPYNQEKTCTATVPKRHPSADSAMAAAPSNVSSTLGDLALIARYFDNIDQVKALEDDLAELQQEWQARASPSTVSNSVGRLEIPWDTEQPSPIPDSKKPCFPDIAKFSGDDLTQLDRSRELLDKIKALKKQLNRINKENPGLIKLDANRSKRSTQKPTYLSPKHCGLSLLSFCAVEQQDRLLALNSLLKFSKISPLSPISLTELKHDSPSVASTASPSPVRTKIPKSKRRASTELSPTPTPKHKKRSVSNNCGNKSTVPICPCTLQKSSDGNQNSGQEATIQDLPEPTISSKSLSNVSPSMSSFSAMNNDKNKAITFRNSLSHTIKPNINSPDISPLSDNSCKKSVFKTSRINPVIEKARTKSGDSAKYGKAPTLSAADDRRSNSDVDSNEFSCPVLTTPYEAHSQFPAPKYRETFDGTAANDYRKSTSSHPTKSSTISKTLKKECLELSNTENNRNSDERPPEEMRPPTPDIRKSDLELSDLSDGLRILLVQNTHLRAGSLSLYSSGNTNNTNNGSSGQLVNASAGQSTAVICGSSGSNHADAAQLVYSVRLDGDRRQQEFLLLGWQVLGQAVMEVVPSSIKHLPPRTRVCAYWSDQLASNLYPGTVEEPEEEEEIQPNCVPINFDDGDRKQILLDRIRILPENFGNLSDLAPSIELEMMGSRRKSRANSTAQESQPSSSSLSRTCNQQSSGITCANTTSSADNEQPLSIDTSTANLATQSPKPGASSHPTQWSLDSPGQHTPVSSFSALKESLSKSASPSAIKFQHYFQDQFRSRLSNVQSPSNRYNKSGLSPQSSDTFDIKKRYHNVSNPFKKEYREKRSLSQPSLTNTPKNKKNILTKAQLKQRAEESNTTVKELSPNKKRGAKRRNIVKWSFQEKPIRKKGSRVYYKEIVRDLDKHSVQVGDSVEFSSGEAGNTYLGHVRDIYYDLSSRSMMISAAWYYYPNEAGSDGQKVVHLRDAVFISEHVDPNEVRCIIRKANVQPSYAAFKAFMEKSNNEIRRNRLSKKKESTKPIENKSTNETDIPLHPLLKKTFDKSELFGDISSLSSIISSTTSSEDEDNTDEDEGKSQTKSNTLFEENPSKTDIDVSNDIADKRKEPSSDSDSETDDEDKEKVFFVAGRFNPKNNRVYEWDPDLAETLGLINKRSDN